MKNRAGKMVTQRQLRVGEMIKQSLGMIFVRNEAKVPNLETNNITVTEVKMSQDLKIAKAYVLPLGGVDADEKIQTLKEYSFLIRKVLYKGNFFILAESFFTAIDTASIALAPNFVFCLVPSKLIMSASTLS